MKVILYMAMSVNGLVATEEHDTTFVSEGEWTRFCDMLHKMGNLIVGRKTYESMIRRDTAGQLTNIQALVVAVDKVSASNPKHAVVQSPQEAIQRLRENGFTEAVVAGGPKLNATCMVEDLIDEIHLNIEPVVFCAGIGLFMGKEFHSKLRLIDDKRFGSDGLILRYKVIKT